MTSTKGKNISDSWRVIVGNTKDPDIYQVWHPVLGKGTRPLFVKRSRVMETVDELIRRRDVEGKDD